MSDEIIIPTTPITEEVVADTTTAVAETVEGTPVTDTTPVEEVVAPVAVEPVA